MNEVRRLRQRVDEFDRQRRGATRAFESFLGMASYPAFTTAPAYFDVVPFGVIGSLGIGSDLEPTSAVGKRTPLLMRGTVSAGQTVRVDWANHRYIVTEVSSKVFPGPTVCCPGVSIPSPLTFDDGFHGPVLLNWYPASANFTGVDAWFGYYTPSLAGQITCNGHSSAGPTFVRIHMFCDPGSVSWNIFAMSQGCASPGPGAGHLKLDPTVPGDWLTASTPASWAALASDVGFVSSTTCSPFFLLAHFAGTILGGDVTVNQ